MNDIKIISIGKIENKEGNVRIVLGPEYSEGLKGLKGYSHVQILWWADGCDNKDDRDTLVLEKRFECLWLDLITSLNHGRWKRKIIFAK